MPSDDDWSWKFTPRAADQFDALDPHVQDRIVTKLDEVIDSEWRSPDEFLEPLTGGPFSKLRIGQYRLACTLDRHATVLEVHRVEHRSGAYTADDDRESNSKPPDCTECKADHSCGVARSRGVHSSHFVRLVPSPTLAEPEISPSPSECA